MLHVVLLILKILGIIFLSILGVVLLLLLALLFAAVTYRADLEKSDTVQVKATAGWLWNILSIRYVLVHSGEIRQELKIRLFGIPIVDLLGERKPKKKKQKKKPRKVSKPSDKDKDVQTHSTDKPVPEEPKKQMSEKQIPEKPDKDKPEKPDKPVMNKQERSDSGREPKVKKQSPVEKVRYAIRGVCDKIKGIWDSIKNLFTRIRDLRTRAAEYYEFWDLDTHRDARRAIYQEIGYLWKKIRPRRIEGILHFGFEDPSVTGQCLGALSVLYAWYPKKLRLQADFEQQVLEGNLLIKGRVRLYIALLIFWRIWRNRDIRQMYEHWQQI